MRLAAALALLAALLPAAAADAAEVIRSWVQTVDVDRSDRLDVVEEITVVAEGDRIRRGIYRDFPTVFVDAGGARRRVGFTVESVTRDGAPEPWRTSGSADGVRVWIGDEDVFLAPGTHTYRIAYTTTRQLRTFPDHDELFWNVTGNEWAFPILEARATVHLPEGVEARAAAAYTGRYGERGGDYVVDGGRGSRVLTFRTTRPLGVREGLTILVEMPPGTVLEPTAAQRARNLLLDHGGLVVVGAGLALVLAYYAVVWARVGRDPPGGPVIPLFEPPEGISAPLAQYVHARGLTGGGWTALSAAWIALAVRGLVEITPGEGRDGLAIARTDARTPAGLPAGEARLLRWLDERGRQVVIGRAIGPAVARLLTDFRSAVHGESRTTFFHLNRGPAILGIVLSAATVLGAALAGAAGPAALASVVPLVFAGVFAGIAAAGLRLARRADGVVGLGGGLAMTFVGFVLALLACGAAVAIAVDTGTSWTFPAATAALVVLNAVFFRLLEAPTAVGRKVMDDIEGLILYMTVAEEERLNMKGLPPVTPTRYETLLPYAVALGVEKPWTDALRAHLATAAAAGTGAYSPAWFHGRGGFDATRDLSRSVAEISRSFQTAVPPPKSSSSGSSGGSGGGGGGGGGGGW